MAVRHVEVGGEASHSMQESSEEQGMAQGSIHESVLTGVSLKATEPSYEDSGPTSGDLLDSQE